MLGISYSLPVRSLNAGYFLSRGEGRHPRRVIDSFELIYLQSGTLRLMEEGRHFEVQKGECLLLWPQREHWGVETYAANLAFYWMHFRHQPIKGARQALFSIPQHAVIKRPDYFINLFRLFLDDQETNLKNAQNRDLILMQMLHTVCETAPAGTADGGAVLAQQAFTYVQTHFQAPITTAHVADALACNPDYLGRIFRQNYGKTLTQVIHEIRLQHAAKLLMDSTLSINEISLRCGFTDCGYFRRLFKRHKAVTPGSYRKFYAHVHVNTE